MLDETSKNNVVAETLQIAEEMESSAVSIMDLERWHCHYILDHKRDEHNLVMYCGKPAVDTTSWCSYHLNRVADLYALRRQRNLRPFWRR